MQVDKSDHEDSDQERDWLKRTEIILSGSTPRVNIKPQSKYIQALIYCAVDLGERYIFLGPPEDEEITTDDVGNMTTPFSVTGLHSIAFSALLSAAQQLVYTDENDVYDRLTNGSEELYIKPLRYHVRDFTVIVPLVLKIIILNNRSFKDSGSLERRPLANFLRRFLRSSSSTRLIKQQSVYFLIRTTISSRKNQIAR
jgi:hypothetical protein